MTGGLQVNDGTTPVAEFGYDNATDEVVLQGIGGKVIRSGSLVNGKVVGELMLLDGEVIPPSEDFPFICLTDIDTYADYSADQWPMLIPVERNKIMSWRDPSTGTKYNTLTATGAVGQVITFENQPYVSAILGILNRHVAAFGAGTDFGSIGTLNDGTTDYLITGVDSGAARSITVASGTPAAGTYRIYPHRIAGSTTQARIQSWRGRAPVGANGAEGQTVSGFMRVDAMQGHWHAKTFNNVDSTNSSDSSNPNVNVAGLFHSERNGDSVTTKIGGARALTDGVNNTPRIATTTHPADSSVNIYKHAGRYIAP